MNARKIGWGAALALWGLCGWAPLSLALPTTSDTLNFQGAIFTLSTDWDGDRFLITYTANFDNFEGGGVDTYLKAIDWKWEGGNIDSVTLTTAPGGADQWVAQTFQQIGTGDAVGCVVGGGSNAVCAEYIGSSGGLSTATPAEDLLWVFEVSFKELRQRDIYFDGGLRAAFVDGGGQLAAPIMGCAGAGGDCAVGEQQLAPLAVDANSVPAPGVPALLLSGLAGWCFTRRRTAAATRG